MAFILLVAFSALFVAGCAAFFSIKGLIVLFSGSALAIGIMASSLEIGKLVAASFLHTHWKRVSFLLKTYLTIAVFVLMCITSLGIFGFLTGAYQVHSAKVNTFDTKIEALMHEKSSITEAINEQTNRIKTLTEVRTVQEQRVQAAGNYKAPRDQAYKAIADANEEIQKKEVDVAQSRRRSTEIDKELAELKITLNTTTDIGSFKFIADALHTSVDTAVQYFIFLLIFVFDPLAVTLTLALNNLTTQRKEQKQLEEQSFLSELQSASTSQLTVSPEPPFTIPATTEAVRVQVAPPAIPVEHELIIPQEKPILATEEAAASVSSAETVSVTAAPPAIKFAADFENDPEFKKLTEEQKNVERARRRMVSGVNDSVITA